MEDNIIPIINKPSLRESINEHCKQCMGIEGKGNHYRKEVENCLGYSCALYAVRPTP